MKESLDEIAQEVIRRLYGKVVIHRYDSHSTDSIYLKFDYGLAYSLRISDHPGKDRLIFRYNILSSMGPQEKRERCCGKKKARYYGPGRVQECCNDIVFEAAMKRYKSRDYGGLLRYHATHRPNSGFWRGAVLIKEVDTDA